MPDYHEDEMIKRNYLGTSSTGSAASRWRYDCPAGYYSNVSLIGLLWDIVSHRFWHFRRGDGWVD